MEKGRTLHRAAWPGLPMRRWWSRVWAVVSLVHPFPAATVVITSGVLVAVALERLPPLGFFLRAVGAVAMTQIAVGALNDYLDRHSDAAGQPWKPIPSGSASGSTAVVLVLAGLLGTVLLGASFGLRSLLLLSVAAAGGLAYDLWLKPTPASLLGYLVGFLALVTWIWFIAGRLVPLFAVVYPLGTIAILTAHLAQSLPDVASDRERGHRGLAVSLGAGRTEAVVRFGLVTMSAGASILAVISGSRVGIVASALGVAGVVYPLVAGRGTSLGPERARNVFRGVAIAVALLAIGALASLNALIS